MPSVGVVIVAHNSGPLLTECVERVLANEACGEVVVVDNASSDRSIETVRAIVDRRLRVEVLPDNRGFAVACNRGAALTAAPWLLFLNPDALLKDDTLSRLLQIVRADAGIGLLGADVRDARGQREAAARRSDPTLGRLIATQLARLPGLAAMARHGLERSVRDEALSDVDAVSGALMLLSRRMFERVGGFDEGFFLHAEDLDLCRRVRASGDRVVVANAIAVTHAQGTSSRSRPYFVVWHKHRSLWRYFSKHEGLRAWSPRGVVLLSLLSLRFVAQSANRLFRPR